MGVSVSDVCYTSATTGRGDHEVHKGHVVALAKIFRNYHKNLLYTEEKIRKKKTKRKLH
jgi:hypothetical protein